MADTTCLYTTLRNTSGGTLQCSFLPPHGSELAANTDATIWGWLLHRLDTGGRLNLRKSAALEAALKLGSLTILQTPVGFFYDVTLSNAKTYKIDNGTVGVADPCSGSYHGSF